MKPSLTLFPGSRILCFIALFMALARANEDEDRLSRVDQIHNIRVELDALRRQEAILRSKSLDNEADALQKQIQDKTLEMSEFYKSSHELLHDIKSSVNKRDWHKPPSDEISDMQKQHEELRRQGKHEEAELVHMAMRDKMKSRHLDKDRFKGRRGKRNFDGENPDDMDFRHRQRRDDPDRRRFDVEAEIEARHSEMTQHRVDELKERIEKAGFSPEEAAKLKAKVEVYKDLEMQVLRKRFDERRSVESLVAKGLDHEAAREKYQLQQRSGERDDERDLRDRLRDTRRDIESRIRDKMYEHQELR